MPYDVAEPGPSAYTPSGERPPDDGWPESFSDQIAKAKEFRRIEVMCWDLAIRFLSGDQNVEWDRQRLQFVSPQTRGNRNYTVTNKLLPHYRTTCSLLAAQWPALTVRPASPSADNVTKAVATREAALYWFERNEMVARVAEAVRWLSTCGNAAFHTYWEPGKKKVSTSVVSAYDLLYEAGASSVEESGWVGVRHVYLRKTLKDAYPDHAKAIEDFGAVSQSDLHRPVPEDRVEVWEVYFKDGRHCVTMGDTWLWKGRTPKDVMPVQPMRFTELPGRAYGMSQMYPLLDLQRQYNRYKNYALDVADAHSNPVWLAPTGAGIQKQHLTNAPNAVVWYNPAGGRPERLMPVGPPQQLFEIQSRADSEMMDVGGMHSPSFGKRAVGITSGKAMETLMDADMGQMGFTMGDVERAFKETARVAMVYWQAYLREPQYLSMFDPSVGSVLHKELAATDLCQDPEVWIEPGTLFRQTAAERQRRVMELWQAQVVTDPQKVVDALDVPMGNQDAVKKMIALSHAQDLLEACKAGLEVEVFPTDDTASIRAVFEEYVRSEDYYAQAVAARQRMASDPAAQADLLDAVGVQDYIRDVLVSVSVPPGTPPEVQQQLSATRVFPPAPPQPVTPSGAPVRRLPPELHGRAGPTPPAMQPPDMGPGAEAVRMSVGAGG